MADYDVPITGIDEAVQTGLTGRYKLYKVTLEEVRVPRTWDNLEDVPIDVAVTDRDGDRIFRSGNRYVYESGDNTLHCYGDPSREVPFTEILED